MIFNYKVEQKLGLRYFSGGGSSSSGKTKPQLTPEQFTKMYGKTMPGALGTVNNMAGETMMAQAGGAANANPLMTASTLSQMAGFTPAYAQMGANLAKQQAANTSALIQGAGGKAAQDAYFLNSMLNPAQAAANQQSMNLLNSINMNGLSPGEQNAIERSLNQSNYATGQLGLDNATTAVSNAMNFGNAQNQKIGQLSQALGTANQTAANQNQQLNPFQTAMQAGNTGNNFGLSLFNPNQAAQFANTPYSFASSFGNQLAGIGSASTGKTTSGSASGGCFITTVVCEWLGYPDDCDILKTLRRFRDQCVPPSLVKEYYQVAPAIAARIKDSKTDLHFAWAHIEKCVEEIKYGSNMKALELYIQMVKHLR